jgi:hypothetical protein
MLVDSAMDLSQDEMDNLSSMLVKYAALFPAPRSPLKGRTSAVVYDIDIGSELVIRCFPRRLSLHKIDIKNKFVEQMLQGGQKKPSDSPWSALAVLKAKKDDSTRLWYLVSIFIRHCRICVLLWIVSNHLVYS